MFLLERFQGAKPGFLFLLRCGVCLFGAASLRAKVLPNFNVGLRKTELRARFFCCYAPGTLGLRFSQSCCCQNKASLLGIQLTDVAVGIFV